jgi:ABC-type multidrug transport system ATPase subunit
VSYAIDVTNLVVQFSDLRAVDDVSFHVPYGQVTTLLGPNGAGKTTLVETLLGFRSPEACDSTDSIPYVTTPRS